MYKYICIKNNGLENRYGNYKIFNIMIVLFLIMNFLRLYVL